MEENKIVAAILAAGLLASENRSTPRSGSVAQRDMDTDKAAQRAADTYARVLARLQATPPESD